MSREEAKKKAKQERARQRRALRTGVTKILEYKPLDEWDDEELARGRPRGPSGTFQGVAPNWVARAVHEEAIRRFTDITQANLRAIIPKAIRTVEYILDNDEVDEKGKPYVPMSTKLDAAKWVVEHLVGKPTQRVEADISVRLQGLLANVLVQPDEAGHRLQPSLELGDGDHWEDDQDLTGSDDD